MDRGFYEKLSIRDSARSLKQYGSTSKHIKKTENYIRHYVTNSDTLQGIALKYDVSIEQILRVNKLWASDSLFLKEFLLIPVSENTPITSRDQTPIVSPTQTTSTTSDSFDDDESSIKEFLGKIDASIANTKEELRKTQNNSEFISNYDLGIDKRKQKTDVKLNNGSVDLFSTPPQTVVVQRGKKIKTSLRQHEQQQAELFEL